MTVHVRVRENNDFLSECVIKCVIKCVIESLDKQRDEGQTEVYKCVINESRIERL